MIDWLVDYTSILLGAIVFFAALIGIAALFEWLLPSSLIEKIKNYHNRH